VGILNFMLRGGFTEQGFGHQRLDRYGAGYNPRAVRRFGY
jgi:hypothetical protein